MAELLISTHGIEVWHGDSLDPDDVAEVMGDRRADLLCVDAPYSARTHNGHRSGKLMADRATAFSKTGTSPVHTYAARKGHLRADLEYQSWSDADVSRFCELWLPVVNGWCTTITDHVLGPAWTDAFAARKLCTFPPLPWVEIGSRVRMQGDGPSMWSCQLIVARGTLPGAYVAPAENAQSRPNRITGGKSLQLMCRLLSDYSRRGQLVVDPCLGGGTTAIAARMTGRRCIGVERDRERAELCARLVNSRHEQGALF